MEYRKNQIAEIEITDLSDNGEGIGKINGYTLFIKDAVIGDVVKAKIMKVKKNYGYDTKIIAASIRNVEHVQTCAIGGADIATIPFAVLSKLITNPLTKDGLEKFRLDAAKTAALTK